MKKILAADPGKDISISTSSNRGCERGVGKVKSVASYRNVNVNMLTASNVIFLSECSEDFMRACVDLFWPVYGARIKKIHAMKESLTISRSKIRVRAYDKFIKERTKNFDEKREKEVLGFMKGYLLEFIQKSWYMVEYNVKNGKGSRTQLEDINKKHHSKWTPRDLGYKVLQCYCDAMSLQDLVEEQRSFGYALAIFRFMRHTAQKRFLERQPTAQQALQLEKEAREILAQRVQFTFSHEPEDVD